MQSTLKMLVLGATLAMSGLSIAQTNSTGTGTGDDTLNTTGTTGTTNDQDRNVDKSSNYDNDTARHGRRKHHKNKNDKSDNMKNDNMKNDANTDTSVPNDTNRTR